MMNHATRHRFCALAMRLGITESAADAAWEDLSMRYQEAHRHYHHLGHLDSMLGWLDKTGLGSDEIELAIWYHDCIYDSLAKDNEVQSATHFRLQLGYYLIDDQIQEIERLILATIPSQPRSGKADEALLEDIDLSVLGSSPEVYEQYSQSIRREYQMIPRDVYCAGRAAILTRFLEEPIYQTQDFAHLESQARENIQAEIRSLRKGCV